MRGDEGGRPATSRRAALFAVAVAAALLLGAAAAAAAEVVAPDGCTRRCGDISIPYPFGVEPGCYLKPGFNLTCDRSRRAHKLFLGDGTVQVLEVSIANSTVRTNGSYVDFSDTPAGTPTTGAVATANGTWSSALGEGGLYTLAPRRNRLLAMGCDDRAVLLGDHNRTVSTCSTFCNQLFTGAMLGSADCSGAYCCQAKILLERSSYRFQAFQMNGEPSWFYVVEDEFSTDPDLLLKVNEMWTLPAVLNWRINHTTCHGNASSPACRSSHSFCKNHCQCAEGYQGNPYVTQGCRGNEAVIFTRAMASGAIAAPTLMRLDRAFINAAWGSLLFNSILSSLPRPVSDHVPIVVAASSQRRVRSLKWVRAERKKWARERRRLTTVISNYRIVLALLDLLEERRRLTAGEHLLRNLVEVKLSAANQALAIYWKQRYTFKVCKLGDENTRFFHASASARLRHNHIAVLHSNGVPVYTHEGKERLAWLDELFTEEEAKGALWSMRSPGPDGFGPAFFRSFWLVVGEAVMNFLRDFHGGSADMDAVNRACVVLLPKKEFVIVATDFRPVSLQNCAPKIFMLKDRKKPFVYRSDDGDDLVSHFASLLTERNLVDIIDPQIPEEEGEQVHEVVTLAATCTKLNGEDRSTSREVEITLENLRVITKKYAHHNTTSRRNDRDQTAARYMSIMEGLDVETSRQYSMEEEMMLSAR
uniref:Wall-associated receptor kinase galacturonan-binding domain-containing protein n=1 Tax=Setaria viridis TaxID=4556 RepID=A0A4U6U8W7_SETVI|nr:hypothetical protein SEVIR_6G207600v2 [Setaria viridis]